MTPERKAEIDAQIEWWRQQENWRKNGFNIATKDPLFAAPKPIPRSNMPENVLHCLFRCTYYEHGKEFEFTKRIKYQKYCGDFETMYLEITWETKERLWNSFWKKTIIVNTKWIDSDNFVYRFPHKQRYESTIVDCNDPQPV